VENQNARPMRRNDREIDQQETEQILLAGSYGVLSTVGCHGEPYGVPISYVFQDGDICFHSAPEGRKLDNLAVTPRASFCVVGHAEVLPEKFSVRYASAIAEGPVRELRGDEKLRVLTAFLAKYSPGYITEGMEYIDSAKNATRAFALRAEHISGKRRK
jgi:nitroimidazol reductase NimA-like FMN-containing flavoprotein (pyridoxamine 5'-phosphate oxidase superfamily)